VLPEFGVVQINERANGPARLLAPEQPRKALHSDGRIEPAPDRNPESAIRAVAV